MKQLQTECTEKFKFLLIDAKIFLGLRLRIKMVKYS